jgi:hypothetical protein
MAIAGEVWKHADFYTDSVTGELLPKYLLVLAVHANKDITYRLLTSRELNRVKVPPCLQSGDRPGYYIGIPQPTGQLNLHTWVDLRVTKDYDALKFQEKINDGVLVLVHALDPIILVPAMYCAAYAQDTRDTQKNQILDAREKLVKV